MLYELFCTCSSNVLQLQKSPLPCNSLHRQYINAFEVEGHVERTVSRNFTSNAPRETKHKTVLPWERGTGMPPAKPTWWFPVECGGTTWRRDQAGKPEAYLALSKSAAPRHLGTHGTASSSQCFDWGEECMNYLTLSIRQKHADEQLLQHLVFSDQCVYPCLGI